MDLSSRTVRRLQAGLSISLACALTLLAACSSKSKSPRVFVLNGLDIPVSVTIEADGKTQTFEVAPKGRATPDVSGDGNVKVTSTKGELISEGPAVFGKAESKDCFYVYNVVGSAAYVNEDVAYGTGEGTPRKRQRSGSINEQECGIDYPFVEPPETVTVKQSGPAGANIGWLHYEGDGGWVVAVNSLLDDTGESASLSRGMAQQIVRAVVTHDPQNPALPAIKARLEQMRLRMPEATPGNLLDDGRRRRRK